MAQTSIDILREPLLGERENILKDAILQMVDGVHGAPEFGVEVETGALWIGGVPIYRQTFTMENPGTGDIVLPHGIDGLDLITASIEGYCILANGTKITLPVINHASGGGGGGGGGGAGDSGNTITLVQWDDTDLVGYIGTNYVTTVAVSELTFTIYYTKTA